VISGLAQVIYSGILLPESFLESAFFVILSAFVAINTIVYFALAIAKMLPKVYLVDWIRGANRRTETRSIRPNAPIFGEGEKHSERREDYGRR
jgi:hypothetical protein